jgi:hypothetical protein
MSQTVIIPFKKNKAVKDLRTHLDGPGLLGNLVKHLDAIGKIEVELEQSIKEHSREEIDESTGEVSLITWTSTTLDKETIAVYHTRINARKLQLDVGLKMLNKVMPDLKAVETLDDIANASERALKHFAAAAAEGTVE